MKDGNKHEGLVKIPGFSDKNVKFKTAEPDKAQAVKSKEIRRLIFKDKEEPLEMEYLNCMMKEAIIAAVGWGWVTVVTRGAVSTYTGKKPPVAGQRYVNNEDITYCHREGEKHAIHPPILGFATTMAKYFEDYPELSSKIKNKADGYQRENINAIVAEYNEWKGN